MYKNHIISVIIPCYKTRNKIKDVITNLPSFIDYIILIDDSCPQETGRYVEGLEINKVIVIFNDLNKGVGGATKVGLLKAKALKSDYLIKIDSDGQMNAGYISQFLDQAIDKNIDYIKGNRFYFRAELSKMPRIRLLGNSFLSFLVKFSSGNWNISDPTNGFICISKNALSLINLNSLDDRYFFEISLLIECNINSIQVYELKMPSIYNDENSSLSIINTVFRFPYLLLKGFYKRILLKYFIYEFNIASLYILFGIPLFTFGLIYGIYNWLKYSNLQKFAPTGTIMISMLTIILGFQLLLQAITFDVLSNNKIKSFDN